MSPLRVLFCILTRPRGVSIVDMVSAACSFAQYFWLWKAQDIQLQSQADSYAQDESKACSRKVTKTAAITVMWSHVVNKLPRKGQFAHHEANAAEAGQIFSSTNLKLSPVAGWAPGGPALTRKVHLIM